MPDGNDESNGVESVQPNGQGVARHLTALTRYSLSAPIQALARFGFLDGSRTVFDYGCGRGDDVRGMRDASVNAHGWDPYYAADEPRISADIVNLGFVINVIENIDERTDALLAAYALANQFLVVSAMLANQESISGTPYGDGVITTRNTFQKYYLQSELKQFVHEVLDEDPIPVGPGIFFIFKDKDAEQRFMYGRLVNRRSIFRLSRLSERKEARSPKRASKADTTYQNHRGSLEALWESWLSLGREPDREEVQNLDELLPVLGSLSRVLRFIKSRKEDSDRLLEAARYSRIEDLKLYFAQIQFERRKPYRRLEARLQKDIRCFFGDYAKALGAGRDLLFATANTEAIAAACLDAAEHGIGWLDDNESLQLHTSLVEQLPAILRAYVSCAAHLYGDVSSADLIKIHIHSGKLTLMMFDDFVGKPLPRMLQRIKVNLRTQDMEVFEYSGAYQPPYLYGKSRFINEEFANYAEQVEFEETLASANLIEITGYGPPAHVLDAALNENRYVVDGFCLARDSSVPSLDDKCGRYLTYRQLIQCGETQERLQIPNLPTVPESYTAILDLAKNVLDPVIEYFGMIKMTYGFCSDALAKNINARIAPKLDQHAAHERNRQGKLICDRLGAAADFLVEHEDMFEVAQWIYDNLQFDRMYIYRVDRPIHISYGPDMSHQVVQLIHGRSGRLLPRVLPGVSPLAVIR